MTKNAVTKVEEKTPTLPSYLQDYQGATGQDFERADVAIPQIKIGQGTSDEVKDGIVDEGALFLNVDGTELAAPDEELEIVVVAKSSEYILWRDRKFEGGGIMARAPKVRLPDGTTKHKWDQPNTEFENKIGGMVKVTWKTGTYVEDDGLGEWGSENPDDGDSKIAATKHYNYVVYIPSMELIASLSLSRTATKPAKQLNALLMMGKAPIFSRLVRVRSFTDQRNGDKFKNWRFRNPKVKDGERQFVDEATFEITKSLFQRFEQEGFVVDQSGETGEDAEPAADNSGQF